MDNFFLRTQLLIGEVAFKKLQQSTITVFGIGGVGSFATEALARAGIGTIILVDGDNICPTNINRQIHATSKTIGLPKVEVMQERILAINPQAKVFACHDFYVPGKTYVKDFFASDYIIDAIDDMEAKTDIINKAWLGKVPVISAMGAANKLEPAKFEVADIFSTSIDPICRIMRKSLRKLGIDRLKVVYSTEQPKNIVNPDNGSALGSISFVPSVMGLLLAGEVVLDLIDYEKYQQQ